MKKYLGILLAVIATFVCSCGGPVGHAEYPGDPVYVDDAQKIAYYEITPAKCNEVLAEDVLVVCVDTVPTMQLPGTDLYVPYTQIEGSLNQFPKNYNAPILVYCAAGRDSYIVSTFLAKSGYTYVMELKGGAFAYSSQGYVVN
ncbi:MAG: rhodanese-like domain-containing protein [Dehalococcoidales bacterium]|nr:rhodanese-like domain-containing protein [Dehalococcoidales bacterium]